MAADNPFANLGTEFMRWQSIPSLSESIAKIASGGGSPVLKTIGMLLAGGGSQGSETSAEPALGQGIAPPSVPGGQGMSMNKPSGIGIAPGQFQVSNLAMPKLGTPATPTNPTGPGIDVDGDGQIDNFWGIKK